jgi:prefoldin subunit 5
MSEGNGKGSIDERLEKLVERHEALTQSVEMLSADVAKLVKTQESHEQWLVMLTKIVARHDETLNDGEA